MEIIGYHRLLVIILRNVGVKNGHKIAFFSQSSHIGLTGRKKF